MTFLWHGLTDQGVQVPVQVDDQGRVVVSGGGTGPLPAQLASAWGSFASDGTSIASYGVSSINRAQTGVYNVTLDQQIGSSNYSVVACIAEGSATVSVAGKTTTGFSIRSYRADTGAALDRPVDFAVFTNGPA